MSTDIEVKNRLEINQAIKEPPMFKVIYINDDQTSMEFVIETLIDYFDYSVSTAHDITMDIHQSGSATVAVLPYEIAEQKGIEVSVMAKRHGFPLVVKLEADE